MKAKSIKGKTRDEIQIALLQSIADGFKPTLAIVFLSVSQDRKAISKVLSDAGIKIFGATTNGEFIDENPDKQSVAILLLDINPDYFTILFSAACIRPYFSEHVSIKNIEGIFVYIFATHDHKFIPVSHPARLQHSC